MVEVKTSQKTLIDLYLAFVRTWILEYQLNSIARTAEELSQGKTASDPAPPSTSASSTAPPSSRSVLASADMPPREVAGTETTADTGGSSLANHRVQEDPRGAPAGTGTRIPPLEAARGRGLGRGGVQRGRKSLAVASRPTAKQRVDKLALPTVARMVLEDCAAHWRDLAQALEARAASHGLKTILVTGGSRGEGCTTVAVCLAVTLARRTKRRCLLLDADFAHPGLAEQLGVSPAIGLEEVLVEKRPIEPAIMACGEPKLDLLLLREGLELPALALGGKRMRRVMEKARGRYDLVIMDGGCRFEKGRPVPIPPGVDAALLVRNPTATSEWLIDKVDGELAARGISCLGVIENEP